MHAKTMKDMFILLIVMEDFMQQLVEPQKKKEATIITIVLLILPGFQKDIAIILLVIFRLITTKVQVAKL